MIMILNKYLLRIIIIKYFLFYVIICVGISGILTYGLISWRVWLYCLLFIFLGVIVFLTFFWELMTPCFSDLLLLSAFFCSIFLNVCGFVIDCVILPYFFCWICSSSCYLSSWHPKLALILSFLLIFSKNYWPSCKSAQLNQVIF